jgi:hypothetical protein
MNRLALTRRLLLMLGVARHDAGADFTCIAAAPDIEPADVGPLVEVAETKLRRLAAPGPACQSGPRQPDNDPARGGVEIE